jgi:hypothetical protein
MPRGDVSHSVSWREFDSYRRLQGHALYATVGIPLSGFFESRSTAQNLRKLAKLIPFPAPIFAA